MLNTPERQTEAAPLLLATKLYVPRARPTLLSRPRLLGRLDAGLQGPITLIAAPTGSGKTALLTDWLRTHPTLRLEPTEPTSHAPVAWLSLDPGDDDLLPFLRYLVAACQTLLPSAGNTVVALLESRGDVASRLVMTTLINDLARLPAQSILVLDDYHVVSDVRIHDAVTFLLDHLPPQAHVVITSRVDPPLPLARWRAHGSLTELRAADLRFTAEEATTFLTQVMCLPLAQPHVEALEQRTEGWIAGLQFAALAMRDRADLESFVRAFTGSHRFVLDFLVDEVLLLQPPHVQTFLLRTSILDRMCAPLCDAVLDGSDTTSSVSQRVLEALEQANLFVVPLDDVRQWYRYHHLFADALRHRLQSSATPEQIQGLRTRASAWFEQHGYVDEAVRQALAGGSFATAARLIEQEALARQARGELATLRHWLAQIPDDLLRERPLLGRARLLALIFAGRFREIEPCLHALEQSLGQTPVQIDHGVAVSDDPALRVLAGEIAASRALFANLREQTDLSCALSDQALALLPQDHLLIGFAHYSQGASALVDGDAAAAVRSLQQAQRECQAVGNLYMLQVTMAYLGQARRLQGRLHDAIASYEQGLRQTPVIEGRPHAEGNGLLVGLGALHYERNDLAAAERTLSAGIDLARDEGNALVLSGGLLVLAGVRLAQQALDAARLLLAEATALLAENGITWLWVCGSVAAYQAGLALQIGHVDAAAAVLEASGRARPAFLLECDELARARVRLAQGRADNAQALLEALLPAAERTGRTDHVIKGTALLALARAAQGHHADAHALIERALCLGMSEGYLRTFVDLGTSMHQLLRTLQPNDDVRPYLHELLAAVPGMLHHTESIPDKLNRIRMTTLAEPLTTRECEVLQMIAAGKSNGEIAAALVVAVSTVKAHINSIFGKLGATSRTQALVRAQELGVL